MYSSSVIPNTSRISRYDQWGTGINSKRPSRDSESPFMISKREEPERSTFILLSCRLSSSQSFFIISLQVTYSPPKHECFGWSFFSLKTPDGDSINELSPLAQRHRRPTPSCFRFSQEFLSLSW